MNGAINIARLVNACGTIEGRKKLQKIVYLLQSLGYPFREDFRYLHYGPYSSQVKNEIDWLVDDVDLIDEKPTNAGPFQTYLYTPKIHLTEQLKGIGLDSLPEWAEKARELNQHDAQTLEAISTVVFLRKCGYEDDRLRERFGELKPKLMHQFDDALQKSMDFYPAC